MLGRAAKHVKRARWRGWRVLTSAAARRQGLARCGPGVRRYKSVMRHSSDDHSTASCDCKAGPRSWVFAHDFLSHTIKGQPTPDGTWWRFFRHSSREGVHSLDQFTYEFGINHRADQSCTCSMGTNSQRLSKTYQKVRKATIRVCRFMKQGGWIILFVFA